MHRPILIWVRCPILIWVRYPILIWVRYPMVDDERDQLLGRFSWLHKAWRTAPTPLPGWQAPSSVILDGELLVYDEVPLIDAD